MAYEFLSDSWIAAAEEVRERFGDLGPAPVVIVVNLVVTDAPFSTDALHAHLDTRRGPLALERGHADDPHLTVTVEWSTAKAILVEGQPHAAMSAFMNGKIKVDGDLAKLLELQKAPINPRASELLDEVQRITA